MISLNVLIGFYTLIPVACALIIALDADDDGAELIDLLSVKLGVARQ